MLQVHSPHMQNSAKSACDHCRRSSQSCTNFAADELSVSKLYAAQHAVINFVKFKIFDAE